MAAKKTTTQTSNRPQIPDRLFFRIGDVAELLGVKPYVLRYWETEFPIISPQKSASGYRQYRRIDVETVQMIKQLLYEEKYSIEGARRRISELRKEGELKSFRQGSVAPLRSGFSTEKLEQLRELARDLNRFAKTPISQLFINSKRN